MFLRIPLGFRCDKGMIFNFSVLGALGAEAPSKKSAGNEEEEEEADDETREGAETELPLSCFLWT